MLIGSADWFILILVCVAHSKGNSDRRLLKLGLEEREGGWGRDVSK